MDVYRQASEIVSLVRQGNGTAKALSLRKDMQKKKQTYAVVCETLRHYELLEDVLEVAEFFKYYPHANKELAICMAYDVVLGKGVNTANDSTARAISQSVAYLREAYWRVHKHHIIPPKAATWESNCNGENDNNNGNDNAVVNKCSTLMPRYARVNILKIALDTLVERLRRSAENKKRLRNGEKVETDKDLCESQLSMSIHDNHHESNAPTQKNKNGRAGRILPDFMIDSVVPSLLVFPPNTDLHAHPAVKGGQLILQDKASCLPACILLDAVEVIRNCKITTTENDTMQIASTNKTNNTHDKQQNNNNKKSNKNSITNTVMEKEQLAVIRKPLEYVIDACAAPGNKTTHLAALGAPDIKIMAIERDEHRAELLQKRVAALAASDYVNVVNMDFFDLSSDDRDATEGILLDPSCSASGVMTRVDVVVKHATEKEKILNRSNNNNSYSHGKAQHHYHRNKTEDGKEEGNDEFVKKQREISNNYGSNENDNGDDMEMDNTTMKSYDSKERVEQLSRIQRKMLTHALVSFNNCRSVVYSTCSIHEEENEDVVRHVLSDERVLSRG